MRPAHALLLLVVLAGLLIGALVLVKSDSRFGRVGEAAPDAVSPESTGPHAPVALDPTGGDDAAEKARVSKGGTPVIVQGPVGLRGRIVDVDGRPVAGADVYAAPTGGIPGIALDEVTGDAPWMKRVRATSDAQGRFTLNPEAQGSVRLAVRADGFAPFDTEKSFAGADADVGDLVVERGVVLMGRVVDPSGRPVAGAEIHRVRRDTGMFFVGTDGADGPVVARTDAAGAFRVDRIAAGPWTLRVTSAEYPDKDESGETDRPGQVVSNLVVTLEAGTEIAGHVTGIPGDVTGLVVRASPQAADGSSSFGFLAGTRTADVDRGGNFVLRGCRADTTYRVAARTATRDFMNSARSDSVEAKSGERNVMLTYKAETALVFQVVDDATGKPVESMSVTAGYRWTLPLMEPGQGRPQTNFPRGNVRFAPLPGGGADETAQLRVEAAGYEPYTRADLRVVRGVDNDLGIVRLKPGHVVRVHVVESSTGAPIAGAQVSINEFTPSGGERGLTFTMDVTADGEGEPFLGSGGAHRARTDKEGVAVVSSMPGKRVTISVRDEAHAAWKSEPIDLPTDSDHEATARLLSGGTVVVSVVDAKGQPVAGLDVDHRGTDGPMAMFLPGRQSDTVTDADGKVAFAHIAPGRHLFRVRPGSGGMMGFAAGAAVSAISINDAAPNEGDKGWVPAEVVDGETITVQLVAPDRGTLTGRVREAGKALVGASVRLQKKGEMDLDLGLPMFGGGASGKTNGTGEYSIAGATAGDYRLVVTHPSRAMPHAVDVTVREGSNRLDVELPLAILEGRVTGEDGKPIPGVRVTAERYEPMEEGGARMMASVAFVMGDDEGEAFTMESDGGGGSATTDTDGRYRLRGVTADVPLRVLGTAKGLQPARSSKVEVSPDQTLSSVDLVMKLGGTVDIVARGADGKAARGCMVHAHPLEGTEGDDKMQFAGPSGKTSFTGLAPGRWRFQCDRPGFGGDGTSAAKVPDQEVEVKAGESRTVTFQIPP